MYWYTVVPLVDLDKGCYVTTKHWYTGTKGCCVTSKHWYTGTKGCYVTSKQGVGGEWEIKFSESDICERLAPAQSATGHMLSAGHSGPGTHVIIEKHGSLWLSTLTLYSK